MRGITACIIRMLILIFTPWVIAGPPSAESVTEHLTGSGQRAWVKTRWEPVLAAEGAPQCKGGEIWRFDRGGKGIKKTCENGLARQREFGWSWIGIQDDQPILQVDEKQYIAELRQRKAKMESDPPVFVTVLRALRASQAEPVEEITLEFQDM